MARHKVYSVTWDEANNRTTIEVEGIIEPVRNGDEIEYHRIIPLFGDTEISGLSLDGLSSRARTVLRESRVKNLRQAANHDWHRERQCGEVTAIELIKWVEKQVKRRSGHDAEG